MQGSTTTTTTLTERERELLALFRELDEREQRHVYLAAQAVKANSDRKRNPFAF